MSKGEKLILLVSGEVSISPNLLMSSLLVFVDFIA